MADLDVDQWRNAQNLILKSAKEARRLIVMLEKGEVVKCRHTTGRAVANPPSRIEDLSSAAKALYEANKDDTDFVLVMERDAADEYFANFQNSWQADEDLDVYVRRTYASLDEHADTIVTYPGPARETLGLQWQVGASYEDIEAAVRALVDPGSTVVLAVHDGEKLWTSLILSFDADLKVVSIGTADPSLVEIVGSRTDVVERLVRFADAREGKVGLVADATLDAAKEFLSAPDKGAARARLGDSFMVSER
ncbi:MAG: hypothetical protein WAV45_09010 [Propionibacteriaceae bacterium]